MTSEIPTSKRLTLAFEKLKRDAERAGKNAGPSISAVAREAGVSHTLVHLKHPKLAEKIRDAGGRSPKQLMEKQRIAAKKAEARNGELRTELSALKQENRGLASENARLLLLVTNLECQVFSLESGVRRLQPKTAKLNLGESTSSASEAVC